MPLEKQLTPWTQADKDRWYSQQRIQRSYAEEVLTRVQELSADHEVTQYGTLKVDASEYPLFLIRTKPWSPSKQTVLITGGVHGYETSGVQGALAFMRTPSKRYSGHFNLICAPCISPWAYETINRWNPKAIDPNRSFVENSPAQECKLFLDAIDPFKNGLLAHFDLHETTDTDNTVFRPALEQRDGKVQESLEIPDGFYTVADSENPRPEFQAAVVSAVRKVTRIALADAEGKLIGATVGQEGVIHYPYKKLALCGGISNAQYTTTTEVYPDSPRVTPLICIEAQVAAVAGGLDFIYKSEHS